MDTDQWLEKIIKTVLYHQKRLDHDPAHSQKQTALELGLPRKLVSMYLSIYSFIDDPEVTKRRGLNGAYKTVLAKRKHQNQRALERLLT